MSNRSGTKTRQVHIDAEGFMGKCLSSLQEGVFGEHSKNLLLIEYEALCLKPKETMAAIYRFIDEPEFDHDFENVSFKQESFDDALRTPYLNTVDGPARYVERKTVLLPDVFEQFSSRVFWRGDLQTNAARLVLPA